MTTQDKTGDQLVASIRKSKSGEVARKNTKRRATSGKKTSTRKKKAPVTGTRTKKSRTTGASAVSPAQSSDDYSAGGRIWPD